MIGDPNENYEKPVFKSCLDWILSNQMAEGFWGERDCHGNPTFDSLPATLPCIIASKMWDFGHEHIEKGMLDLAWRTGLRVMLADEIKVVAHIYDQQRKILKTEELVNKYHYPPLLSYLDLLPSSYQIDQATIIDNLSADGSLFQSPAATAAAYIATGNPATLSYLFPSIHPIDEDCIKLYMVNQLQRLGLFDHFDDEIAVLSKDIYSKYNEVEASQHGLLQANVFKNSLAFEVLRLQGYKVSPRRLCGFLNNEYTLQLIEDNHEMFESTLNNLYRVTNLMFETEVELKELRSFSRRLLEKSCICSNTIDDGIMMWPRLQEWIKREILVPWMGRMDHLDHIGSGLKQTKTALFEFLDNRISCLNNMDLLRLAKENYEYRQMVYKKELTELIRWDNKGLTSHSKILFDILDNFVGEVAKKYHDQHQINVTTSLRKLWYEAIDSWLIEATWSKTGHIPSMSSYIEIGMISVAAHVMRESKDGKINSVMLYLRENQDANMEEAVDYLESILEGTKMRLLEHALITDNGVVHEDLPKSCKMLHLTAVKVFHMFYNSTNHFDLKDSLLNDINKAI
uniref:Uncharacterized protein n=1 Tax=Chenopodium quinoa TaxID=63459 RepID=A0A803LPR8_CHEQI